ncbi:MAG: crossover junction endodeoxyribonuclease RuvC [Patescibacteria group bacterium]
MTRILGLDPGTETTGFGIIEVIKGVVTLLDYGCIKTERKYSQAQRLSQIRDDLDSIIKAWNPGYAAVEKLFFSKNVKTAMAVSESRGVLMQKLQEENIWTQEYTPNEIKMNICGDGKAEKKSIQKMVQLILKLKEVPTPDDAADALAIALCFSANIQFHNS